MKGENRDHSLSKHATTAESQIKGSLMNVVSSEKHFGITSHFGFFMSQFLMCFPYGFVYNSAST